MSRIKRQTPKNRPYFFKGIVELEQLAHQDGVKLTTLKSINSELKHRDTDRAARLGR